MNINLIASKILNSTGDIPNRKPDRIDTDKAKIWDLGENRKLKILPNGSKAWYKGNEIHREDGPAIEHLNGSKYWYLNGKRHREDGPAIEESDGYKEWDIDGKLHREDGPAIEHPNGTVEYYLNGFRLDLEDFESEDFQDQYQELVNDYMVRRIMHS